MAIIERIGCVAVATVFGLTVLFFVFVILNSVHSLYLLWS